MLKFKNLTIYCAMFAAVYVRLSTAAGESTSDSRDKVQAKIDDLQNALEYAKKYNVPMGDPFDLNNVDSEWDPSLTNDQLLTAFRSWKDGFKRLAARSYGRNVKCWKPKVNRAVQEAKVALIIVNHLKKYKGYMETIEKSLQHALHKKNIGSRHDTNGLGVENAWNCWKKLSDEAKLEIAQVYFEMLEDAGLTLETWETLDDKSKDELAETAFSALDHLAEDCLETYGEWIGEETRYAEVLKNESEEGRSLECFAFLDKVLGRMRVRKDLKRIINGNSSRSEEFFREFEAKYPPHPKKPTEAEPSTHSDSGASTSK